MLTLQSELVELKKLTKIIHSKINPFFLSFSIQFHGKQLDQNVNQMELIRTSVLLFWSLAMTFVACEFGEMLTNQFCCFNETIEQCDWYAFPHKIQRIFVVVVANTQQPTYIHSFGNIPCSRDSFKRVSILLSCSALKKWIEKFLFVLFCFRRSTRVFRISWFFVKSMDKTV